MIKNLPLLWCFPTFSPLKGTNDDCEFIGRAVNSELTSIPKDHYMFLGTNWEHCSQYVCVYILDLIPLVLCQVALT